MNKKIALYVTAIVLLAGIAACNNEPENRSRTNQPKEQKDAVLPENCYKRLEGSIAGQPVVMHLLRTGDRYNISYAYTKQGKWILLNYDADSSRNDLLYLSEYSVNNLDMNGNAGRDAHITARYTDGALKGTWFSGDGAKQYDFTLKDKYPEGSYTFTAMGFKDSAVAFAQKPESPVARVSKYFPVANGNESEWLNTQLRSILYLDKYKVADFSQAVKQDFSSYLNSYKEEVKGNENDEFMAMLNYESMQEVAVSFNQDGFVIFRSLAYDYEGGAHGNYGTALYCLDVKNKKKLALSDVLTADSITLKPIVEKNFRLQAGLSPSQPLTEYLFENELPANSNFYFTEKGIGFLYNPYEVAAYAAGEINVFIPYTDVRAYLKPDFAHRLHIK